MSILSDTRFDIFLMCIIRAGDKDSEAGEELRMERKGTKNPGL